MIMLMDKGITELSSNVDKETTAPNNPNVVEEFLVNLNDEMEEDEEEPEVKEVHPPINTREGNNDLLLSGPFKRARQSGVWKDLSNPKFINKEWFAFCKHCETKLKVLNSSRTTHYKHHLDKCPKTARQSTLLNFLPSDSSAGTPESSFVSALHNGKLDMLWMREGIAHWIVMHEK
ncbi:uncharacterized protein LOC104901515 [Beta vulgaris subsp. vulgaris]|uniref:uncharacterized protein LOC104901515 n=1 Tax=Beta vulgaris subsp. vulgaris TaxID=3555 RepID=UPI00053FD8BC|nr:uncharacterized protein LOC104901515 [Beta vulgaris subsp. vulgaris]